MKSLLSALIVLSSYLSCAQHVSTIFNSTNMQVDDAIIMDKHGNIYGSHYMGSRVYKISPSGLVSIVKGGLNTPNGLALDSVENLYIVDNVGNRVYKLDSAGNQLFSTFVSNPSGIIHDLNSDSMIITQYGGHALRKISSTGQVNNIPMFYGPPLNGPVGLCYGQDSSLYVGNFTDREIYRVDDDSLIYVATIPGPSNSNLGFITHAGGFIYGTNFQTHKIYKVDPNHLDSVVLYSGSTQGNTNGPLSSARFNGPNGIYASSGGDSLLISDFNTGDIRLISGLITGVSENYLNRAFEVYPNPSNGTFFIKSEKPIHEIELFSLYGRKVWSQSYSNSYAIKISLNSAPSTYVLKIRSNEKIDFKKVVITKE